MAISERACNIVPVGMRGIWAGGGAGRSARHLGRAVKGGIAAALAVVGLVAFATPAFAHDNLIAATASCANPAGSGFTIVWTIQNDFNEPETGSVTSVTGGLATLNTTTYSIAASPGQPYSSTTLTQTLPPSASGLITIDISSTWSDSFSTTDSGSYDLGQLNCGGPHQTIAGHIYLCNNANPTTTEQSGGTLAASGPTPVSATPNPLAPTNVGAGGYTMTATAPAGYQLVVCGGSSTPNASGSSATEPVTVPSGGAGLGIFYVVPVSQTIAGHIYLCNNANPTTTEQSGGTLAASGPTPVSATPNPLAPTNVGAGGYTMTATAPAGYQLVVCGGSSTPNASGSSATEPVTVPSGGAGLGIFYVVPVSQTIAGHIYLCNNANPTTTEQSGGTLAASGPTPVSATPNPLAPTNVGAGGYTMTATAPAGYQLVVCGGSSTPNASGSSATEPVTVPSGGAGLGIFYVVPVSQTIAGHIYLCNNANPTTTEQSGGTLAASGPTPVSATPNPLAPTNVGAGGYTMTATAPAGYQLVVCGGSSTPNASGSSATEPVTVPSGGAGLGIFYVVAPSNVTTNPTTTTSTSSGGSAGSGGSATTSPASTASATPSSATTGAIAFTGAPLLWEWLGALVLVLLGSALLAIGRWQRVVRPAGWLGVARAPGQHHGFTTDDRDLGTQQTDPETTEWSRFPGGRGSNHRGPSRS